MTYNEALKIIRDCVADESYIRHGTDILPDALLALAQRFTQEEREAIEAAVELITSEDWPTDEWTGVACTLRRMLEEDPNV